MTCTMRCVTRLRTSSFPHSISAVSTFEPRQCKTNFTTALRRPLNVHEKRIRALGLGGPDACIDAGDLTAVSAHRTLRSAPRRFTPVPPPPSCPQYLNQPSVIAALHVVQGLPWEVCTGNITYTPTEPDERRIVYPTLLEAGVRVLVYNGCVTLLRVSS